MGYNIDPPIGFDDIKGKDILRELGYILLGTAATLLLGYTVSCLTENERPHERQRSVIEEKVENSE